jgi:hypothetical protein
VTFIECEPGPSGQNEDQDHLKGDDAPPDSRSHARHVRVERAAGEPAAWGRLDALLESGGLDADRDAVQDGISGQRLYDVVVGERVAVDARVLRASRAAGAGGRGR